MTSKRRRARILDEEEEDEEKDAVQMKILLSGAPIPVSRGCGQDADKGEGAISHTSSRVPARVSPPR